MRTRPVFFLRLFRSEPGDLDIRDINIVAPDEATARELSKARLRERWTQERFEGKPGQAVLYSRESDGALVDLVKLKVLHDGIHESRLPRPEDSY